GIASYEFNAWIAACVRNRFHQPPVPHSGHSGRCGTDGHFHSLLHFEHHQISTCWYLLATGKNPPPGYPPPRVGRRYGFAFSRSTVQDLAHVALQTRCPAVAETCRRAR